MGGRLLVFTYLGLLYLLGLLLVYCCLLPTAVALACIGLQEPAGCGRGHAGVHLPGLAVGPGVLRPAWRCIRHLRTHHGEQQTLHLLNCSSKHSSLQAYSPTAATSRDVPAVCLAELCVWHGVSCNSTCSTRTTNKDMHNTGPTNNLSHLSTLFYYPSCHCRWLT